MCTFNQSSLDQFLLLRRATLELDIMIKYFRQINPDVTVDKTLLLYVKQRDPVPLQYLAPFDSLPVDVMCQAPNHGYL